MVDAERYRQNLAGIDGIEIPRILEGSKCSYYSFSVLVDANYRDQLRAHLMRDEIESSIMYHPVHLQPVYRSMYGFQPGDLPITEEITSRTITLPLHLELTNEDIDFICEKLIAALKSQS